MKKLLLSVLLVSACLAADPATEPPKTDVPPKPDVPPKAIKQVPPDYPFGLRYAGVTGKVTLDFIVDTKGNVTEVHVARSNNPYFERPAIDAVMKWKFEPAQKNGRPVNARARIDIPFTLAGMPAQNLWRVEPPRDWSKVPPEYRWDVAPEPVSTLMAAYPFEALLAGKEGRVTASYIIDREGRVAAVKIREATDPTFGAAVIAMIDGWRFKPARKADGSATFAVVSLTRDFQANGRGDVPVSSSARALLGQIEDKRLVCAKADELDVPLKPVSSRPPIYPSSLREAGQDGEAMIEFYVDKDGDAQLPRIVSATDPAFGYAAAQAVATWRFVAPKRAGKAVVVRAQQLVKFHLKEPIKPPPAEFVP